MSDDSSKIGECEEKGEREGEKVASRKKARVMGPTLPPPSLRDMPDQVYICMGSDIHVHVYTHVHVHRKCACIYIVHTCIYVHV